LRSRAAALLTAAAAHVFAIYILIASGYERPAANGPSVTPIVVRLIDRARPPVEAPVTINPELARVSVSPPQAPDFHIDLPAEPIPGGKPETPVLGSPGAPGSGEQVGATLTPLQLTVTHYVAPVYSPAAARAGKHGRIVMAVRVDARGDVDEVKVLHSTGSSQLDEAAVKAARQWRFAPDKTGARKEPVWGQVGLLFAPPQRFVHVPLIVMPYPAVAKDLNAVMVTNGAAHPQSPSGEASLHSLLQELVVAFAKPHAQQASTILETAGDSVEALLGLQGPIQSLQFLGFVDHGIDHDRSESSDAQAFVPAKPTHWEVYDVKQDYGSSVWLIAVTAHGSIQRIEVAVR